MSSVHAGLSGSLILSRGFLWQLGGSSEFHFFRVFGVNHHNHFSLKKTKANQALFAIVLPLALSSHREMVPHCIASNEVKPVLLVFSLRFDSSHVSIVNYIYKIPRRKAKFNVLAQGHAAGLPAERPSGAAG
jgi:hypothetical protein